MSNFKLPQRTFNFLSRYGRLPVSKRNCSFKRVVVKSPYETVKSSGLSVCVCSDFRDTTEGEVCVVCGVVKAPELRLPDAWEDGHSLVINTPYNHKSYVEKLVRGFGTAFTHREMIAIQSALNVLRSNFSRLYPKRKNFLCYPYAIKKLVDGWESDSTEKSRITIRKITGRTIKTYDDIWRNITSGFKWERYRSIARGEVHDYLFKCYPLNKGIIPAKRTKLPWNTDFLTTTNMPNHSENKTKNTSDRKRVKPEKVSAPGDQAGKITVCNLFESVAPDVTEFTSRCHADGRPRNMTYLNHKTLYVANLDSAPRFYTKGYDPKVDMETARRNSIDQKLPFDLSFTMDLSEEGAVALSGWHIFTDKLVKRDMPPRANINVKEWMNPEGYYKARIDYRVAEVFLKHLLEDHDIELTMEDIWKIPIGSYKLALEPFLVWKMGANAGLQWKVRAIKLVEKRDSAIVSQMDNVDYAMALI